MVYIPLPFCWFPTVYVIKGLEGKKIYRGRRACNSISRWHTCFMTTSVISLLIYYYFNIPNNRLEISKISVYQTSWYIYILFFIFFVVVVIFFSSFILFHLFIFVLFSWSKKDKYDNYIFAVFCSPL